jgi:hypothetical protein
MAIKSEEAGYNWVPFYEGLADKIVPFRDRQRELLGFLAELKGRQLTIAPLEDKDAVGLTSHYRRSTRLPSSACIGTSLTRELGMLPKRLRDTHPQPLYMSFDNVGGAHAQCCSVHLLSPTLTVRRTFSRRTTNRTWAHFRVR